eukprot:3935509-Rhodomonas_salina.1
MCQCHVPDSDSTASEPGCQPASERLRCQLERASASVFKLTSPSRQVGDAGENLTQVASPLFPGVALTCPQANTGLAGGDGPVGHSSADAFQRFNGFRKRRPELEIAAGNQPTRIHIPPPSLRGYQWRRYSRCV